MLMAILGTILALVCSLHGVCGELLATGPGRFVLAVFLFGFCLLRSRYRNKMLYFHCTIRMYINVNSFHFGVSRGVEHLQI